MTGDLHFMHHAAHGGEVEAEKSAATEAMLEKLERLYP